MGREHDGATLRVGVIAGLLPVFRDLGINVDAALTSVGLNAAIFDNTEMLITYAAYDRLLDFGVRESGCNNLGLLVGMTAPDLGLPGFLMLNAPTVREGVMDAVKFHSHIDGGGVFSLSEAGEVATLNYSIVAPKLRCTDQISDTAIALAYGALRRLIGADFRTFEVRLPRRVPADISSYRLFFSKARLKFDAHEAAIDFNRSCLDAPIEGADPALYKFLKSLIAQGPTVNASMAEKIRRVLPNLIRHKEVNTRFIAQMFGMHPRTMARRLADEQVTLHELVEEARFELAQQLLRSTDMKVTEIAVTLYYSDASAFTRAFRRNFRMTPGAWRKAHGTEVAAAAAGQ